MTLDKHDALHLEEYKREAIALKYRTEVVDDFIKALEAKDK